jgi:hypothetical protein
MYPSGAWRGFWEQPVFGRQSMRQMVLRFEGGRIDGDGVDVIGRFTFTGSYDDSGSVALIKQYAGRHQVIYRGAYDGEGSILGRWSIGDSWSGPFALAPIRGRATGDGLVEAAGVDVPELLEVVVNR